MTQLSDPLGGISDSSSSDKESVLSSSDGIDYVSLALRASTSANYSSAKQHIGSTSAKRCWACGEMWLHQKIPDPYTGIKNM